ncbi:disintegrin and metalloproteinase domain-containing protein 10 [Elysia marginata]|uniref:Disintegrin and metalloproteinase domain-containing protein 10 n=1 Tax=Elysia marginata TaxID=1093978 RepID=A0AAV4GA58_9GAST|nr:disintegrin and metalloproteinase domain-containing protein 10 [Elysia marginata]
MEVPSAPPLSWRTTTNFVTMMLSCATKGNVLSLCVTSSSGRNVSSPQWRVTMDPVWRPCVTSLVVSRAEAMCYTSCTNPETGQCVSSYNIDEVKRPENHAFRQLLLNVTRKRAVGKMNVVEPEGIQLPAGSPCDNFRGYCDVFHKCRGVDADGPLARLKNLIFNRETLENIQHWIMFSKPRSVTSPVATGSILAVSITKFRCKKRTKAIFRVEKRHWWAVLLMGIALIVVMGAFIKICAVHTPSSNPRKPKARQLTLPRTLQRRRHHQNQQQQQGQGYGNRGGNGGRGGGQSSGAAGRERRPMARSVEERKPNRPIPTGAAAQEPPPPYSSAAPLTSVEIVGAPSSSSSPAAPMIEPVGAPDLSAIPPGGPKRGRGGARALKDAASAGNKGKKGGKKDVELQRL